jgi:hypothetical protein
MAYGTVKVDNITFDNGGSDQNIIVSGLYNALTSGVSVTGTISGSVVIGSTSVSGTTVLGTTVTGTTVQGVSGTFTSLTGTTTTGTTANFVSGVFSTQLSGAAITGNTAQFTSGTFVSLTGTTITGTTINGGTVSSTTGTFTSLTGTTITGTTINAGTVASTSGSFTSLTGTTVTGTTANFVSGRFTTQVSGTTVTGTTSNFTSGNFTALSGATATFTSGVIASGTATNPSLSFVGDPNTGIYSPGADQVAVATNGAGRLFVNSTGFAGIGTSSPQARLEIARLGSNFPVTGIDGNIGLLITPGGGASTSGAVINCVAGDTGVAGLHFGTASSPNTGRILHDNSTLSLLFSTNSTERLRITSAGLVGIGTSAPSTTLHVQGATGTDVEVDYGLFNGPGSAQPGIYIGGNNTTASTGATARYGYIRSQSTSGTARALYLQTGTDTRVVIDNTGNVGIGTTSPGSLLDVRGTLTVNTTSKFAQFNDGTNDVARLTHAGTGQFVIDANGPSTQSTQFWINGSERARIDSSGRLLVGTSSALTSSLSQVPRLQVLTGDTNDSGMLLGAFSAGSGRTQLNFVRSKSSSIGANTVVVNGDVLGEISWNGADGTGYIRSAQISAEVDGTPGANDMPGRLVFSTTADGASSPTERMRITSAGVLQIADAGSISVGTTTGTKIGTATTQKLGFYNATPVVQPAAVANATDAATVITQLNDLLAKLRTLGIIAT